jgi:hypothetical protein
MATGFKVAQVNASLVPSTQTNFPSYVDLSRLGITTLAEAQSVRVYADGAKTTEWAREIVSATEMHVKVPSLTSTVEIYVDYDGVRADYAVTDTYGRNAVWTDYDYVGHFEGNSNDSSGNGRDGTDTSITYSTGNGRLGGQGAGFNGSSSKIVIPAFGFTSSGYSLQLWLYRNTSTSLDTPLNKDNGTSRVVAWDFPSGSSNSQMFVWNTSAGIPSAPTLSVSNTTWAKVSLVWETTNDYFRTFKDGAQNSNTNTTTNPQTTSLVTWIGADQTFGGRSWWDGNIDEVRIKKSGNSNNWETTEYNNQSNESSFWGTWTDAGGGATPRGGILLAW